ncbi:MAG: hydantoinase B/oxoprolinase family protein, partial [Rhizobiales bacterium]|nr:hydantoinase B/oxoprolinase family protein [Hyphomicrobiales bacterium]
GAHPVLDIATIGAGGGSLIWVDDGGGAPGLSPNARDVHSEGIILPPTKFSYSRDWNGGLLERLLRANVRAPLQTMGDCDAQIAANRVGARRVIDLCAKYGAAKVMQVMAAYQDYAERRFRAGIEAAPDGVYEGLDFIDDDGITDRPVRVRARVTIDGDRITVDYDGTDPQVRTTLNAPLASTLSATLSCVKSVLTSPDIPFNAGVNRAVEVRAPKGTVLNPTYPAPVRARMEICYRAFNATMKALAKAVPDKVIACGFDVTTSGCLSWLGDEGYAVYLEIYGGGYGASATGNGCDGVDMPLANCANTPAEAVDQDYSFFRVEEYALTPDSFGHGAHRGGAGFVKAFRILKDGANVALYSDRFRFAPEPLFGGTPGTTGSCAIHRGGEVIALKSKDMHELQKGDLVVFRLGGGAGYGRPEDRALAAIESDIANGLLTSETARAVYPHYAGSGRDESER